jgi:hypothetical protein
MPCVSEFFGIAIYFAELIENWDRAREGVPPKSIEPLE